VGIDRRAASAGKGWRRMGGGRRYTGRRRHHPGVV